MNSEVFNQIVALIEEKMGKYSKGITSETCLDKDLGIIGDDAVELLLEYGEKFKVDLSRLNLKKYFVPEGDTILPMIIRFFTGKKDPKDSELTVGHLEKGVVAGRLDEEVINS